MLSFPWCLTHTIVYQEDVLISHLETQVIAYFVSLRYLQETPKAFIADPDKDRSSYEWDVFLFGCLFYEVTFILCLQSYGY